MPYYVPGWGNPGGGGGGGGGSASGYIYITDVTPQGGGVVSDKVWQDSGGNTVLQSCKTSTMDIRIAVRASYPKVEVGGVSAYLTRDAEESHYAGSVDVTITADGPVTATVFTPDDETGPSDTVMLDFEGGPSLLTLSFTGAYPGVQTELKEDDTVEITGTTDVACTGIRVLDWEAGKFYEATFPSTTNFTVSIPIADRGNVAVLRPARVQARNAVGAYGGTRDTNEGGGSVELTDVVNCNNLHPTVVIGTINYPPGQTALKNTETATVAMTTANLDTINYTSPGGELTITNPSTDETPKTVQRLSGNYNVSTPNYRAEANRVANDATTVATTVVAIAHVAATMQVSEPAARLISGGNDGTAPQDHEITLTLSQEILSTPTLDEQVGGGVFQGVWAGGPTVWTRDLRVHDNDTKGTYTWQNPSVTNRAGIVTSSLTGDTQYELGGFVSRNLSVAPFGTTTPANVVAVDFAKVTCDDWTFTAPAAFNKQPIGTPPSVPDGWTISGLGANPHNVIILDTAKAAASSQPSTIRGYREDA